MPTDLDRGTENRGAAAVRRARLFIKSTANVYFFLVGILMGFIQVNQGAAEIPKTHHKSMLASWLSACIYCLALVLNEFAELEGQQIIDENYFQIFFSVILIIAGFTPASLVSVLVQDRFIWVPYCVWFTFSVMVVPKACDFFTGFLPAQNTGPETEN